ncbi:MAG TPA: hypothetical protein VNA15_11830 [Candidatus Angelobacter sp.]|nr:hypothetical protein [Candidatus Angelobacter sp.]
MAPVAKKVEGGDEGVGFKLSDMFVKPEASRLLILKAVRLLDDGKLARLGGAIGKLFARGLPSR